MELDIDSREYENSELFGEETNPVAVSIQRKLKDGFKIKVYHYSMYLSTPNGDTKHLPLTCKVVKYLAALREGKPWKSPLEFSVNIPEEAFNGEA